MRHLTARDLPKFEECLQLVLKHAWTVLKADTIRLDLHHFQDASKPDSAKQADPEVKAIVAMNRKGFKWKTLINDAATGRRYQTMQMARPADYPKEPPLPESLILKVAQLYHIEKDGSTESAQM